MSDHSLNLLQKYNVPGPRYTSYPTVPYWQPEGFDSKTWLASVVHSFAVSNEKEGISLYIHLPYCESLCTFCGCNKRITKNHGVEEPYIAALLAEWDLYCDALLQTPALKEIHLGGGTPTFFAPDALKKLIEGLFKRARKADAPSYSFEGHPNNTTKAHLQVLYHLGFNRVSFGVQDYDPLVQKVINRVQSFEQVQKVHHWALEVGYTSISHDLIFGLPKQTINSIEHTLEQTNCLKPDRIAFYSYAHVPWIKGSGQRGFDDSDLPKDTQKRALYEAGKVLLAENGYHEIGMDHFALPTDSLYLASQTKSLHRNFMGYSASKTRLMIGLGVSAIGDSWQAFAQNEKSIDAYYKQLEAGNLPVYRGHVLNKEDLIIRQHILNLMCNFKTSWEDAASDFPERAAVLDRLTEMQADGLIEIKDKSLKILPLGIPYLRNCCMAFDLRLLRKQPESALFSMCI